MERFTEKKNRTTPETAMVTANVGMVQLVGSATFQNLQVCAPLGLSGVPPLGQKAVLLPLPNGETVVLGYLQPQGKLSVGELMWRNEAGATIVLKQDGSIRLNGLTIDAVGNIIPPQRNS